MMNDNGGWRLFLISQDSRRCGDLEIYKTNYLIGRDEKAADGVILSNPGISRLHCRIDCSENGYSVTDLSSSNGTKLNGEPLTPGLPYRLTAGDIMDLAGTKYAVFPVYDASGSKEDE